MRVLATIVACAAVLCGCTTAGRSYIADVDGGTWSGPVTLTVPNSDTLGLYDMSIALRHDGGHVGEKVAMTVRTVTPDSLCIEESLTVVLAGDGRSRSVRHEMMCPYRRSVRFAREGDYRIIITPKRPVSGVTAVGVDMSQSAQR